MKVRSCRVRVWISEFKLLYPALLSISAKHCFLYALTRSLAAGDASGIDSGNIWRTFVTWPQPTS
jgi:hypothetical protein